MEFDCINEGNELSQFQDRHVAGVYNRVMTTKTLKRPKKSDPARPAKPRVRRPSAKPPARTGGIIIDGHIRIPAWVVDHASFRQWIYSDEFPQSGRIAFINNEVWVDLSMETLIHNRIKTIIAQVLATIMLNETLGEFFSDGMIITNANVGLSTEPDGCFVTTRTFDGGLVHLKKGEDSLELEGTPDMTLEVISKTSIMKDTVTLKELYAAAGVAEYWLVDSTTDQPILEIFRLKNGKYIATPNHDGWVKSNLFSRSFRLTNKPGQGGRTQFNLETR